MGLVKTVQLAITGDIRDATTKIDFLRADADKLTAEPVELKAELTGTEEVKAKLDDIDAHAELLKREFPEFTAKIDTSAATSKIAVFRRDLQSLTRDAEGGGGGGGGGGLLSSLGSGGLTPGTTTAITGVAAAVSALLPELLGLASGFAAAGTGVGAFALLALPAFSKIKTAYTNINTAQKAYDTATTKAGKATALAHLQDAWKSLDGTQRTALHGIDQLRTTFGKMSTAFEPAAFKVFNDLLKIANTLLPDLTPFANAAATAIDGLLKGFNKFAGSTAFKDWLKQFEKLTGPSITAIGQGFGQVTIAIGQMLTTMSKKDVINAINIAFTVLTDTIKGVTFYIKLMMDTWDGLTMIFRDVRRATAVTGHDMAVVFDGIRRAVVVTFTAIAHWLQASDTAMGNWAGNVSRFIGNVVGFFARLPGEISRALSGLGSLLFNIGKHAVQSLINGLLSLWHRLTGLFDRIKGMLGFGGGSGSKPGTPGGPGFGFGGTPNANAALAQRMMPAWGTGANWAAWNYVGTRESGWNNHALNASSGAYGIPQALPPTKMPFAAQAAGGSSPAAQIGWMISYMRGRYGGPQGAAAHEQAFNWYDSGGMLPRGVSMAVNNTGAPERVLSGRQEHGIEARLDEVIRLLRRQPGATGNAMARGLQGAARTAGARGMYSARGAWA